MLSETATSAVCLFELCDQAAVDCSRQGTEFLSSACMVTGISLLKNTAVDLALQRSSIHQVAFCDKGLQNLVRRVQFGKSAQ